MAQLLTFPERARWLDGYGREVGGSTPFGRVEVGVQGPHDVTVVGDRIPTVHIDDVLMSDGEARILTRPGRITVEQAVGTLSQRRGLRLTRAGKTVTTEVAGRTYLVRMTLVARVVVTRLGHGKVAFDRPVSGFRIEQRADATDLAVALALTSAIDRNSLCMLPAG